MRMRIAITGLLAAVMLVASHAAGADEMETRTGPIEVSYPLPPAADFAKLVSPIAKRYGLSVPAKSFDELRAIELDDRGEVRPASHAADAAAGRAASQPSLDEAGYSIYIPKNYDPRDSLAAPAGLIVWISPGDGVALRPPWRDVLDRREIIFIAPHDVANRAHVVWRAFMAVESVRQAKRHFNVDPDRIYVAGFSGGGRVASHAAMFFADTFTGCFAMCGCNFYRDVPAGKDPGGANRVWPGFWRSPEMNLVKLARTRSRFVLLSGERDFNRQSTQATSDAMQKEKFAHVTYIEIPDADHNPARVDADWFEKGLAALDAPVFDEAEAMYQRGVDLERAKKLGEAMLAFESAARHGRQNAWVPDARARGQSLRRNYESQLASIGRQIDERRFDAAAASIRQFKTDFAPASSEAAGEMVERLRVARGGAGAGAGAGAKSGTTKPTTTPRGAA